MVRNMTGNAWDLVLEQLHTSELATAEDEDWANYPYRDVMTSIGVSVKALTALRFRCVAR